MRQLFFIVLLTVLPLNAKTLLKLNGTPVTEEEVHALFPDLKSEEALDRYILYRLAITKAKEDGLNQTDTFRKKHDKLLYNEFLLSELSKNAKRIDPSEEEIKAEYEKYPLYRVFHLVLHGEPTTQANKKKLEEIKKLLSKKTPFEKLIVKYSEDPSGVFRGDLDYKGTHNLSAPLYSALKNLEKNTVSSPIFLDGATHLIQWTDKRSYEDASVGYVAHLKTALQKQNETALLRSRLKDLVKTAKIEKEQELP